MRESEVQAAIREALGLEPDLVLWRNSGGTAEQWDGRSGRVHHVRYGLAPGSADLVGLLGPRGRFFALEVKQAHGRIEPGQLEWLQLVRRFGGVAEVVRSVEDARTVLVRARAGEL